MFKFLLQFCSSLIFVSLVAIGFAATLTNPEFVRNEQQYNDQQQVRSVKQSNGVYLLREAPSNNIGLDGYQFGYELSDGQRREEQAQVEFRSAKPEDAVLRVRGSYSWVDSTGKTWLINYTADENGYRTDYN